MDRRTSKDGIELQWATNVLGPHPHASPPAAARGERRGADRQRRIHGGRQARPRRRRMREARVQRGGRLRRDEAGEPDADVGMGAASRGEAGRGERPFSRPREHGAESKRSGIFKVVFAMTKLFAKSAADGADAAIWLASSDEAGRVSGRFFDGARRCRANSAERPQRSVSGRFATRCSCEAANVPSHRRWRYWRAFEVARDVSRRVTRIHLTVRNASYGPY